MEGKTVGRSFLILSIASMLIKILSAIYMPFLQGILGWEGYGIYSVSYTWFIFIFAITTMGAQPAVTKVVTELRTLGYKKEALRAMKLARKYLLIIGIVFTGLFILLADVIAGLSKTPDAALGIRFLAPTIVITAVLASYRGYIQSIEEMQTLAISQIIEQMVNVILSLVFAFLLMQMSTVWGSAGGTIGTSIGALVALVYIYYTYDKKEYELEAINAKDKNNKITDKRILKKILMYGLPITMVAGMQNAGGVIDSINVQSRLLYAGFPESEVLTMFGILNSYNTLLYVPLALVTALSTAIFPKIIRAFTEKNKKDLREHLKYSFKLTYLIVIPAAFGLSLLSKEIYIMLFGGPEGYQLLKYGSIVLVFMSIAAIQNTILQGINKLYLVVKTAGIGILVKFIINYILIGIKSINILGAVVASTFAFLIPAIINHKRLEKSFRIKIPIIREGLKPLIASFAMGIVITIMNIPLSRFVNILEGGRIIVGLTVLILVGIGGLTYFITMIYIKGIKKEDIDTISPKIYKLIPRVLRKVMD